MKRAIVSFNNIPNSRYSRGIERQKQAVKSTGFQGDHFVFSSFEEIGCPDHEDVPYAFKPYTIQRAADMGYEQILWMDSVVYPVKPMDHMFEHLSMQGCGAIFFENLGHVTGIWTSDRCLDLFGVTREEAMNIRQIMACCFALDLRNENARKFLDRYRAYADIPGYYEGDWTNGNGQVSKDKRVQGHRHDQAVASLVIHQLGMDRLIRVGHETFFTYLHNPGMQPVAHSVCLYSS